MGVLIWVLCEFASVTGDSKITPFSSEHDAVNAFLKQLDEDFNQAYVKNMLRAKNIVPEKWKSDAMNRKSYWVGGFYIGDFCDWTVEVRKLVVEVD